MSLGVWQRQYDLYNQKIAGATRDKLELETMLKFTCLQNDSDEAKQAVIRINNLIAHMNTLLDSYYRNRDAAQLKAKLGWGE